MPRSITTTKPTTMNEAELAKAWLKARPRATPATLQELERAGFELLEVNNTPVLAHRHDHATILAAIEAAETTTNNIAADLLELRRQRDDLQAELDACRMTLGGGLDGIAAIQDKLAEVQAERDDLAKAKDEAARLRAAIETPVTGLHGRLAALADQVRILKDENTGLRAELEAHKQALDQANQDRTELSERLANAVKAATSATIAAERNAEDQQALAAATRTITELRARNAELKQQAEDAQANLEGFTRAAAAGRQPRTEQDDELFRARKEIHFLTTDLKHTREALAAARAARAIPADDQGLPVRIANLSAQPQDTKGKVAYQARLQGARWVDMPPGSLQYARHYARANRMPWPPANTTP